MNEEKAPEKKIILVIDDTRPIRILIWKTLEKNFNVLPEEKGSDALQTLRDHEGNIDLIIMDYEMPEMNGDILYSHIQKINPNIPVIVLSGSLDERRVSRLHTLGIKHFLAKPVNLKRLKDIISKILGSLE